MCDFEVGIRSAAFAVLPQIIVKGCAFHYGKAIMKKVGDLGMKAEYSKPENSQLAGMYIPTYNLKM